MTNIGKQWNRYDRQVNRYTNKNISQIDKSLQQIIFSWKNVYTLQISIVK